MQYYVLLCRLRNYFVNSRLGSLNVFSLVYFIELCFILQLDIAGPYKHVKPNMETLVTFGNENEDSENSSDSKYSKKGYSSEDKKVMILRRIKLYNHILYR